MKSLHRGRRSGIFKEDKTPTNKSEQGDLTTEERKELHLAKERLRRYTQDLSSNNTLPYNIHWYQNLSMPSLLLSLPSFLSSPLSSCTCYHHYITSVP